MDLKCTLETKTSKSGNLYKCLVIKLTDTYEKIVYLDKAEQEIVKSKEIDRPSTFPFES